ncbi:MAG: universal stress protein [Pseudomonadota bacterium]|nr:universal stress protein [Pseudomonadota bacterium]
MALRILVPVDETLASFRTQRYLLKMKDELKPTVTLLTVMQLSKMEYRCIPDFQQEMIKNNALKLGNQTLEGHEEEYKKAGIYTDSMLKEGSDPGKLICSVAQQDSFDMICICPNNSSEVVNIIFGSVTNYVVHHAPCPVLLVR